MLNKPHFPESNFAFLKCTIWIPTNKTCVILVAVSFILCWSLQPQIFIMIWQKCFIANLWENCKQSSSDILNFLCGPRLVCYILKPILWRPSEHFEQCILFLQPTEKVQNKLVSHNGIDNSEFDWWCQKLLCDAERSAFTLGLQERRKNILRRHCARGGGCKDEKTNPFPSKKFVLCAVQIPKK